MDDGSVKVIYGPMFSRKTTVLINGLREDKQKYGMHNVLAVKHSIDDRYDLEKIVSHDNNSEKAIAVSNLNTVQSIVHYFNNIKVIYIDEGQFFPDVAEFCEEMRDCGKHVIVAGLDKNYLREDFPSIKQVKSMANIKTHLYAKCVSCGKKAPYTYRKSEKRSEILVGGSDIYQAMCTKCYNKQHEEDELTHG